MITDPRGPGQPRPWRERHLSFELLLALILALPGCSAPTEADRDNRRLLDAILTAIAMKNSNWLEDDARLTDQRHRAGQLTDWEYEQLGSIIGKGKSGDWQAAERLGYEFREAHPFVRAGQ